MNLNDLPPTVTVEQAGEILGVSRRTAYRAVGRGQIPTIRIGRRLLVPTGRLLRMLGIQEQEQRLPREGETDLVNAGAPSGDQVS